MPRSLDINTTKFYIGKYLSERISYDRSWEFPIDVNLEHIRETSNVEDLLVDPEDMDLFPEEIQEGTEQWLQVTFTTTASDFEQNPIPDFGFYGFYYGDIGRGTHIPLEALAISDFYTVPIESGSPPGSREILGFD